MRYLTLLLEHGYFLVFLFILTSGPILGAEKQNTMIPGDSKVDVSTLRITTVDAVTRLFELDKGQLAVIFGSPVFRPEYKTRVAIVISELETATIMPAQLIDAVVNSGKSIDEIVKILNISDSTIIKLSQRHVTTPEGLNVKWKDSTADIKKGILGDMFKLEYPPRIPIATIEELAKPGVDLELCVDVLSISARTLSTIKKTEGFKPEWWPEYTFQKRFDFLAKMFRIENLIPNYQQFDSDKRIARLKDMIEAEQNEPGFWSNAGDLALGCIINILSDYFLFNTLRWNAEEHDGSHVSFAYRIYQVSLQVYTSLWLGANHGTGTTVAFWWMQWNALNDFGYYGVATIFNKICDGLGVEMPAGIYGMTFDGSGWTSILDDKNPPFWFSWTVYALSHPGEPTYGGEILNGAIKSGGQALTLLHPDANKPWGKTKGHTFWHKVGKWLSKLVPGKIF